MSAKALSRRSALKAGSLLLLLTRAHVAFGAGIIAVRVWPAKDYTRVTIESDTALQTTHSFITDPPRLAVDIKDVILNAELKELLARVSSNDPNISGVRVGQLSPTVVRVVFDLRTAVQPQVFQLEPVPATYQYRLVLDLYPTVTADPLTSLIAEINSAKNTKSLATAPAPAPAPATTSARDPLGDLLAKLPQKTPTQPSSQSPSKSTARPPPPVAQAPASQPLPTLPFPTNGATGARDKTPSLATAGKGSDRLIIIMIDPGHGGEDPGAIGYKGTKEKDVVLQIAKLLQERINASTLKGNTVRAALTRDSDFFVPLHERVRKAQAIQADLFVSIHADAFFTPAAAGASVFALSEKGASSAAARWMADKENKADLVGGINIKVKDKQVKSALLDMSTTAQIKDSLQLGEAVLGEIGDMAKLHKGRVEQASFAVLKAPDIPSILVETAFISHPEEEAKLKDPRYQEQLADAVVRGITRYFAKNPPLAKTRRT